MITGDVVLRQGCVTCPLKKSGPSLKESFKIMKEVELIGWRFVSAFSRIIRWNRITGNCLLARSLRNKRVKESGRKRDNPQSRTTNREMAQFGSMSLHRIASLAPSHSIIAYNRRLSSCHEIEKVDRSGREEVSIEDTVSLFHDVLCVLLATISCNNTSHHTLTLTQHDHLVACALLRVPAGCRRPSHRLHLPNATKIATCRSGIRAQPDLHDRPQHCLFKVLVATGWPRASRGDDLTWDLR